MIVMLAFGCATTRHRDAHPIAEDVVCLYEGDLGCVKVRVEENTPRTAYDGRVFFFCSERCREEFLKDPEKFIRYAERAARKTQ